mmetsp:Transcript_2907/g.5565  ORF Transcript_2907/g.5565 Transcript_2907/m.5565 type:complete len:215 (-) Transcript_2907:24-668(-)
MDESTRTSLAAAAVKLIKQMALRLKLGADRNEVVIASRTLAHLYIRRGDKIAECDGDSLVDEALIIAATAMHLTLALLVAPQPVEDIVGAALSAYSAFSGTPHVTLELFDPQFMALKNSLSEKQVPVLESCGYKIPSIQSSPSFYVLLLCDRAKITGDVVESCLLECEALEDEGKHLTESPVELALKVLSSHHDESIERLQKSLDDIHNETNES